MERKGTMFQKLHKLTAGIAFASILLPILFWKRIPDTIPAHYNAVGEADRWSDKGSLILLFFIVLLLLGIMWFVEYLVRINGTSEHASAGERQNLDILYPMFVLIHLFWQLLFAYIILCSSLHRPLGRFFLLITLTGTFAPLGWYFVKCAKTHSVSGEEKRAYREREKSGIEQGATYRTKMDWWLVLLLGGAFVTSIWSAIEPLFRGKADFFLIGTAVFVTLITVPLFFIRYTLYMDYMLIDCSLYGKERIPYNAITKLKKTCNPLSSAAMSIQRIQVDYTLHGTHHMTLISPVRRDEFLEKVEKRRQDASVSNIQS